MTDLTTHHERVLVIDFGSQVTQLIARRLRESGVYCEIHPFNRVDEAFLDRFGPKAVILGRRSASSRWIFRFSAFAMASRPCALNWGEA